MFQTYLKKSKSIIKTMGKKTAPTKQTSVATEPVVADPTPAVAEPAPVAEVVVEKPKKKRTKKTSVPPTETVVEETVAPTQEVVVEVAVPATVETVETVPDSVEMNMETTIVEEGQTGKKKRRLVTKDSFLKASEEFQKELVPLLEEGNHKKLLKTFKVLLNDAYRLMKIKTHQKKQKDATNSGFMRPVKPSVALEKFLAHVGEDDSKPLTRAHLTTVICKYIKENDLQNPKDRRIIFPDEEFKKLFQITEDDTEPLTYYNIQKRIQSHVSRIEETA
jgi:chromatin remodeling complex protein RSC6